MTRDCGLDEVAPKSDEETWLGKEEVSIVIKFEASILLLEEPSRLVDVVLLLVNVVVGDAASDAVVDMASKLAIIASCACRRSSIASRNSRTSSGRSEKAFSIDVTSSINAAASASGVEIGSLCSGIVVASRRLTPCL